MKAGLFAAIGLCWTIAAAGQTHAPRAMDFVPAEWGRFEIQWRPTWEETLAANSDEALRAGLAGKAWAQKAEGEIVALRKVALLGAMVERFPARREKHAEAYRTMAGLCGGAGLRWWASYYGWKLATEFPEPRDGRQAGEGYGWMLGYSFGGAGDPDGREWSEALEKVAAMAEAGAIGADGELAKGAAAGLARLIVEGRRYDLAARGVKRIERLGAKNAAAYRAAARVLATFGHVREAAELDAKAGPPEKDWTPGDPASCSTGALAGLPDDYEMKGQWESLAGGLRIRGPDKPVRPEDVQKILSYINRTDAYMDAGPTHYVSFSVLMDRLLGGLPARQMGMVRRSHEQAVGGLAGELVRARAWGELTALSRRYPWSKGVHEALAEAGELALREGRRQWAAAAFEDVRRRAEEARLREEATVGLWLAAAQESGAAWGLELEMAAVPDETLLPWGGQARPAGEVKRLILAQAGRAGAAGVRLADLKRRVVSLPEGWDERERHLDGPRGDEGRHAAWPVTQAAVTGRTLVLWGPGRMAAFGADGRAAWVNEVSNWAGAAAPVSVNPPAEGPRVKAEAAATGEPVWRRPVGVRGGRSAAVSEDGTLAYRLVNAWAAATEDQLRVRAPRTAVEAVETRTGRPVWSTQELAAWAALTPMGQPAAADGRVYVLATMAGGGVTPWVLVCADGATGRPAWTRPLGWQANTSADLARDGAGVTVHQGAVYCATNMGTVARVDSRDGTAAWVRGYAGATAPPAAMRAGEAGAFNYSREGSSLIVAEGLVVAAPRDYSGVLAYKADGGETAWSAPMVPSDRLVGVAGKVLIAMNDRWICGLELATGTMLWCRPTPGGTGSQAAVVGEAVVLACDGGLLRLAGATGEMLERLDSPGGPAGEPILLEDGTLVEAAMPALAGPAGALAGEAGPLGIPMERAWVMPCDRPWLAPAGGGAAEAALGVVCGRRVLALTRKPAWGVPWQRLLHDRPHKVAFAGDQTVAAVDESLWAFAASDGAFRFQTPLPFRPECIGGDARYVYALTGPGSWTWAALVDAPARRLLWARSFAERLQARSNATGAGMAALPGGAPALRLDWPALLLGDSGVGPASTFLDAATGALRRAQPIPPAQERSPGPRAVDPNEKSRFPAYVGPRTTPGGSYLLTVGVLYGYDPDGHETAYVLPASDQPGEALILDFREMDTALAVLSGVTGNDPTITYSKHGRNRVPYDIARSRVYLDFFDRATGQHLGRQGLGGLHFCEPGYTGFASQGRLFADTLVVTDEAGLYVYRPHAAAARAHAAASGALRDLRLAINRRPNRLADFQGAHARAVNAVASFQRVVDSSVRLPPADRAALGRQLDSTLAAMRVEALQPQLSPAADAFIDATDLTVSTPVQGAEIRYSLDGSDPAKGKLYTGPVPLPATAHVRVVADLPGQVSPASPAAQGRYSRVQALPADSVAGLKPGLAFTFHKSRVDTVTKIAGRPVNDRGVVETFSVTRWRGKDFYGVIFTGYLQVPADGIYRFHLASDDGSQFFIGEKLICNYDGRHPPKAGVWATVGLRAGYHAVKMLYFDDIGDESLLLEYEGPKLPRREVPASALFHKP